MFTKFLQLLWPLYILVSPNGVKVFLICVSVEVKFEDDTTIMSLNVVASSLCEILITVLERWNGLLISAFSGQMSWQLSGDSYVTFSILKTADCQQRLPKSADDVNNCIMAIWIVAILSGKTYLFNAWCIDVWFTQVHYARFPWHIDCDIYWNAISDSMCMPFHEEVYFMYADVELYWYNMKL